MREKNRARAGLTDFACYVDPNADAAYQREHGHNPYKAKHLRTIAKFAQRITSTAHGRGVLVVPPRFWKSSVGSEKLPAWYLGNHPTHSLIEVTGTDNLAFSFSKNVRSIIESEAYQRLFPNVRIRRGSNEIKQWSLEQAYRYSYRAAGVGTNIMGGGANGLIVDDLFKDWQEAQSQTIKDTRWDWLTKTAFNRLESDAWILIICTRWATDDHVGRIIEEEQTQGKEHWDILNLPIEDENGVPLWEERFNRAEIANIKARPGATTFYFNLVYKGLADEPEGNLIKREWFEYVPKFPEEVDWFVRPIDVAFTEKQTQKHDPDYTATAKMCLHNDWVYVGQPRLWRKSIEDNITEIMALKWSEPNVRYGMGRVAIKASIVGALENVGLAIEEYEENTDKIARATAWINLASQGRVKLVGTEKEWEPFMSQFVAFPNGSHDDAVDMMSGGSQMLGLYFDLTGVTKKARRTMQLDSALRGMYGGRG